MDALQTAGGDPSPATTGSEQTPAGKPPLLAGKYQDRAALERGVREASKIVLGTDQGDFARFDDKALEGFYTTLNSQVGKQPPKKDAAAPALETVAAPPPTALDNPDKPKAPLAKNEQEHAAGFDPDAPVNDWGEIVKRAEVDIDAIEKTVGEGKPLPDDVVEKLRKVRKNWGKADVQLFGTLLTAARKNAREATGYKVREARGEAVKVFGDAALLDDAIAKRMEFVPEQERASLEARLMSDDVGDARSAARDLKHFYGNRRPGNTPTSPQNPVATGIAPGGTTHNGIRSKAELQELTLKARQGDKNAQAALLADTTFAPMLAR